ncbi:MMPL family transporter [Rhodococcus sp. NPDC058521]|uniref:MMPL family transporter n=1 Tax=Rhodococcus sp. NPDC058521 TaxID=3346536 RepID=UPI003665B4C7
MTTWAGVVLRHRLAVLLTSVVIVVLSGAFGATVMDRLSAGGYADPGSEAVATEKLIEDHYGRQTPDVVALYTAPEGRTLDDLGPDVQARLDGLDSNLLARPVVSYWNSPATKKQLATADGTQALALVYLDGDENQRLRGFEDVREDLTVPGVDTQLTGFSALADDINSQSEKDLIFAESLSLPITLVVLVLVFGGVVAASLPVTVGVLAVLGSLASLRVISEWFEVNVFAVNVASLLALGLAIDYGLFVVSRFREEITAGRSADDALVRTMSTAGRTIGFSALLLVCAFAGTLVFPQPMLKSLGFGAMSAVAMAALMSLTVLPAALALLGTRIGKWTWNANAFERGEARARRFWGATTGAVLRRPGLVAVTIGALLLLLAAPINAIALGDVDHTALPADSKARATAEHLAAEFPAANSGVLVVLEDAEGGAPENTAVNDAVRELKAVDDISDVSPLGAATEEFVALRVEMSVPDRSQDAMRVVDDIRAIDHPGVHWQLGGTTASTSDGVDTIVRMMPVMLAVMAAATLILMFVAFGSVVLPIKAVVMAFLSLGATFGVLTLIFHNGFLANQLGITPGPLAAGMVVLVISVVFGLSTDYEVFLLSRMVEARAEGADTAEAVMTGATRTGRVVTAAAALLILVTGAFTLSELTPMRFIGIGMITALLIDATLVRMLLVPALVKLMGRANWWPRTPSTST